MLPSQHAAAVVVVVMKGYPVCLLEREEDRQNFSDSLLLLVSRSQGRSRES